MKMIEFKREKSCGGIVYKVVENELFFLLLKHNKGHWSFPKGHMEEGETERETALREIKEETGLDVKLDDDYFYKITYSPKKNVLKDVVYFIATPLTNEITMQYSEIEEIIWANEEDALNTITYDDDKQVFIQTVKEIKRILE